MVNIILAEENADLQDESISLEKSPREEAETPTKGLNLVANGRSEGNGCLGANERSEILGCSGATGHSC